MYLKEEDLGGGEPSGSGSCAIKKFKPALLGLKKNLPSHFSLKTRVLKDFSDEL